ASSITPATSFLTPLRKQTCVTETSAVSSSIAASKRSSGIVPSDPGGTWTILAPRRSCACQIWPIVGNSKSVKTTLARPLLKSSPLASALTPAETDVVTATSSSAALRRTATLLRAPSSCSTQYSHGAPYASQSARYRE